MGGGLCAGAVSTWRVDIWVLVYLGGCAQVRGIAPWQGSVGGGLL